jgi:hypothetical protein
MGRSGSQRSRSPIQSSQSTSSDARLEIGDVGRDLLADGRFDWVDAAVRVECSSEAARTRSSSPTERNTSKVRK